MTVSDPAARQPQDGARPTRSPVPSRVARVFEWLVRRDAIASARARGDALTPAQRVRFEHARALVVIAEVLSASNGAGAIGAEEVSEASQRGAALSLYRESVHWALAADTDEALPSSLADAFDRSGTAARRVAGDSLFTEGKCAIDRSFIETAQLGEKEQRADLAAAQALARALVEGLRLRAYPLSKPRVERWRRILTTFALSALAVTAVYFGRQALIDARHPDFADTAHWKTSSHYEGFLSEGIGTKVRVAPWNIFFCTAEQAAPWIDFDLGETKIIYRVIANNRTDCCGDRTVPLVIELSTDDVNWTQVTQKSDVFVSWDARFPPQAARYVRLRIARQSYLHLESVEIH